MPTPSTSEMKELLHASMSYVDADKKEEWHRICRMQLRKLAKLLDGSYGAYESVRSNKAGIAVSGEVTLHCERLYVQVAQSVMGIERSILYRSCNGLKDYSGGHNNFAHIDYLLDPPTLADLIRRHVKP